MSSRTDSGLSATIYVLHMGCFWTSQKVIGLLEASYLLPQATDQPPASWSLLCRYGEVMIQAP